jgi:hypothetical protein
VSLPAPSPYDGATSPETGEVIESDSLMPRARHLLARPQSLADAYIRPISSRMIRMTTMRPAPPLG